MRSLVTLIVCSATLLATSAAHAQST